MEDNKKPGEINYYVEKKDKIKWGFNTAVTTIIWQKNQFFFCSIKFKRKKNYIFKLNIEKFIKRKEKIREIKKMSKT